MNSAPLVEAPGVYAMPARLYHRDPCPAPSLSASICTLLCTASPMHAWHAHPRLHPEAEDLHAEHLDIGTAAHALLLEGASSVAVVDAKDWRTKAAQEARDTARAAGLVPLLASKWADVQAMVTAARAQLAAHQGGGVRMFTNGHAERVLVWREGPTWCRARVDWLRETTDGTLAIDDYKTTSGSAAPDAWTRALFGCGADVQVAWYRRGVARLFGFEEAPFRFAVQETYPPYALSVISLGPAALVLAEKKVLYALEQWQHCLATDAWPSYPTQTCFATLPPWVEQQWLDREVRDAEV